MSVEAGTANDGSDPAPTSGSMPLLDLQGVSKFFGGTRALADVDVAIDPTEVVALVGDNGAGKSTLVKIVSGVERPDAGEIRVSGVEVRLDSPRAAAGLGIRTVYQDLSLCDNLDTVQNLFLGQEIVSGPLTGRLLDRISMESEANKVLSGLSVKVRSLRTPVGGLSGGQRQGIAICRALLSDPKLVILDEPTAALGITQRAEVLDLIRRLKAQGRGVLVISHDLQHVQQIADRIVVLRLGRKVAEFTRASYDVQQLVAAITGIREGAYA